MDSLPIVYRKSIDIPKARATVFRKGSESGKDGSRTFNLMPPVLEEELHSLPSSLFGAKRLRGENTARGFGGRPARQRGLSTPGGYRSEFNAPAFPGGRGRTRAPALKGLPNGSFLKRAVKTANPIKSLPNPIKAQPPEMVNGNAKHWAFGEGFNISDYRRRGLLCPWTPRPLGEGSPRARRMFPALVSISAVSARAALFRRAAPGGVFGAGTIFPFPISSQSSQSERIENVQLIPGQIVSPITGSKGSPEGKTGTPTNQPGGKGPRKVVRG